MTDLDYDPAYKAKMDELILRLPDVAVCKAFGQPAYKVNGKLFAFVSVDGVAIKLPAARAKELIAQSSKMKLFEAGSGVFWKEWVSIERDQADEYEQDIPLFEESLVYVAKL